jgi:GntR family transcriptional regulator, transcriptional repressor for pyruvate dehydrogenase complex
MALRRQPRPKPQPPTDRGGGDGRPAEPHPHPEQSQHLVPIQRMDVFREALSRIEDHIEANHLGPGDRLPSDRDLAAALGVSRPLVRQALKVLEGLGRVSAQQGSGTYVRDASHRVAVRELTRGLAFDARLLSQVLPARVAIDVEVLRAAFAARTPETLQVLRRAVDRRERERRLDGDAQEASLDLGFEATLGQVCGNEVLRRLQALTHEVWLQAQIALGVAPDDPAALHREHRAILDAFERGDLPEAERLLRAHLAFLGA